MHSIKQLLQVALVLLEVHQIQVIVGILLGKVPGSNQGVSSVVSRAAQKEQPVFVRFELREIVLNAEKDSLSGEFHGDFHFEQVLLEQEEIEFLGHFLGDEFVLHYNYLDLYSPDDLSLLVDFLRVLN